MKKFSAILLGLVMVMIVFVGGCTKADNATLVSIQEKYDYITTKNENIFNEDSKLFNPTYLNAKLVEAINDSNCAEFNRFKSSANLRDLENSSSYGIVYRAISSTSLYTNAFSVANDKITDKEYKKEMYIALENLQKDIKNLNTSKTALENVFKNSSKSYADVVKDQTTIYNQKKYEKNLIKCLKDLYDFNKNYNSALVNNIFKPIDLNDLLFVDTNIEVSYSANNQLINNCNLLISNYILNYSIDLKGDVGENQKLIENLKNLLTCQISLKGDDVKNVEFVEKYKLLRMMEDTLNKEEINFELSCENLTTEKLNSNDEKYELNKNFIQNYLNKLIDYSNNLIAYLQSL